MKKILIIIFILAIFQTAITKSNDEQEAYNHAIKGIEFINNKKYTEAIDKFNLAIQLQPNVISYHYEKALAFTLSKQGDSAISILEGLVKLDGATDRVYQLLSNNYLASNRNPDAVQLLIDGLKRFPKSGRLHMELAGTEHGQQSLSQVLQLWEKGVMVEPNYPDNYYFLSEYFSFTGEKLWSLIYGEIYINWASNPKKREYISNTIFWGFNDAVFTPEDSTNEDLEFTLIKIKTAKPETFKGPFEWHAQHCYEKALENKKKPDNMQFNIQEMNEIRKDFIKFWYDLELNKRFPNALFDWNKKIIELGFNDVYGYWLLKDAQVKEYENWYEENKSAYDNFEKLIDSNPLQFDEDKAVYRMKYK